jgi:hypothetical protein
MNAEPFFEERRRLVSEAYSCVYEIQKRRVECGEVVYPRLKRKPSLRELCIRQLNRTAKRKGFWPTCFFELGLGQGDIAIPLNEAGFKVYGIEPAANALARIKEFIVYDEFLQESRKFKGPGFGFFGGITLLSTFPMTRYQSTLTVSTNCWRTADAASC